jgi:hypothetical protein
MVVVNSFDGNIGVMLGNGNGTFQSQVTYPVGNGAWWVGAADFNGDGKLDLAVATRNGATGQPNPVAILLGNGDGTFQSAVNLTLLSNPQQFLAVGDFNGDGKADLVTANCCGVNFINVMMGNGDGTFQGPVSYATGTDPWAIVTGDFNGDGNTDIAVANYNGGNVSILLNNGNGTFANAVNYGAGASPHAIATADFNSDGKLDLVIANQAGSINILLGNGDGTFQNSVSTAAGSTAVSQVATADFNGDGRVDVIVSGFDGVVAVLLNNTGATFNAGPMFATGCKAIALATGEFNGDGRADFAVGNACGSPVPSSGNVSVFLGESVPLRVNTGGPAYTDSLGQAWIADVGYLQGSTYSVASGIAGTNDPTLYRSQHNSSSGPLTYQFAVPLGSYAVKLKFAEIVYSSAGQRRFDVAINGTTVASALDIFVAAGGANKAYDLTSNTTVSLAGAQAGSGLITITLTPITDQPVINAVEIVPVTPDFNLLLTPSTQDIVNGGTASYNIAVQPLNGFSGSVALNVGLVGNGFSWGYPTNINAGSSGTLNINSIAAAGSYPFTIVGTSGSLSHTIGGSVTVTTLPIRVNAGGDAYTDSQGHVWSTDIGYQQNGTYAVTSAISGTPDPALYRDEHYSASGPLTYQFAVPNGNYTVNLKFAEISYTSSGQRVFDIAINGATVQSHLDIFTAAGGAFKAVDFGYPVNVSTGMITITFTPVVGLPNVNAIEIAPPTPDFTVGASPSSQTVSTSGSTTYTITTTAANGFNGIVSLAVSGLPSGATASFVPLTVTGAGSTTMTVTTSANTPGGTFPLTITATSGALSHTATATLMVTVPASVALPIRINAGGGTYTDSLSQSWLADTGYHSGNTFSISSAISGTVDATLYRDVRYSPSGPLIYQFLVPNGSFTVNLKFAELFYTAAGQRVFDIAINGSTVATHFDAVTAAGAAFKAVDRSYPVSVSGGLVTITLTPVTGLPAINGIEILQLVPDFTVANGTSPQSVVPGGSAQYTVTTAIVNGFNGGVGFSVTGLPTGATAAFNPTTVTGAGSTTMTVNAGANTPGGTFPLTITATSGLLSHTASATLVVTAPASVALPIRVNAGGGTYTDSLSQSWLADAGYQNGTTFSVSGAIAGTNDPSLYRDLRYSPSGPLVYQFLAPNGNYTVNLKFAELFYTVPGQRVFDIAINGGTVTSHFDAVAAAGSGFKAVDRSYPMTVNGGLITITLTPVIGLPAVNAIEILQLVPDFTFANATPPLSVIPGGSAQYYLYTSAVNGFNGAVNFSVSGLPTGATASFTPAAGGPAAMTVNTTANTPGGTFPLTITATSGQLSHTASASLIVLAPVSLPLPIRVNTGGTAYTDSFGQAWLADTGYLQGTSFSTASAIAATTDAALYQDLRYSASGPLSYQFVVPNGNYTVNLKFAELFYAAAGQRVFDVAINGTTVISHLDVFATAGGANKALDASYPVTVANGVLAIALTPVTGLPILSALEILTAPTFTPIRVNAGGAAYTDTLGQSWSADTGYQQGTAYATASAIAGTPDGALYQAQRYSPSGPLTYQFTVANGNRTVKLKFAELYYTSSGQRIFDVAINGTTVTSHLDVFSAAGGSNRALDLVYPVVVAGGQVTVTLMPVAGLPTINAIEIR